jgi:carbamoyl-phosphate synthase large subunit
MGGQTALNLAKEADELGVWERFGVKMIGVDIKQSTARKTVRRSTADGRNRNCGSAVKVANSMLEGKGNCTAYRFPLVIRHPIHSGYRRRIRAPERRFRSST